MVVMVTSRYNIPSLSRTMNCCLAPVVCPLTRPVNSTTLVHRPSRLCVRRACTSSLRPNVATVQTSKNLADKDYFVPVRVETALEIIKKEKSDGIPVLNGGQTALSVNIELYLNDVLEHYNMHVISTQIESSPTSSSPHRLGLQYCIDTRVASSEAAAMHAQ